MMTVVKRGVKLFSIFCGVVAVLFGLVYIFESKGAGPNNFALWVLEPLLQPAIMIRRWLFEIPEAELDYHYHSVIGVLDYAGLVVFYFLVCLVIAWCWTLIKSRKSHA